MTPLLRSLLTGTLMACVAHSALAADIVPDAATAKAIAAAALKAKVGESRYAKLTEFSEWNAVLHGDEWKLALPLPPVETQPACKPTPGYECVTIRVGGWSARISRHDGHVIELIPIE